MAQSVRVLAARFDRPGDPSVLRVDDVAEPDPPTGDRILVRVLASSVNGTDLGLRRGAPGGAVFGRRTRPGFDVVGEVVRCGPTVTAFGPGDRIAALLPHSGGGHAELVAVRQRRAALVPAEVTTVEAAGVPLAGLTALQGLYGKARLGARIAPRVLVHGASGGIGAFAVQLAVLAGGQVTGTASAARLPFVRELGAQEALDSRTHDVTARDRPGHDASTLRSAPGGRPAPDHRGRRWDVVIDTPGVLDPAAVRAVLEPDGVYVTTRAASAETAREVALGALRRGPRFAFIATAARSQDLARLLDLVRTGRLRVPVDRVFPLTRIVAAHEYAEQGGLRGKVIITIP